MNFKVNDTVRLTATGHNTIMECWAKKPHQQPIPPAGTVGIIIKIEDWVEGKLIRYLFDVKFVNPTVTYCCDESMIEAFDANQTN